MQAFKRDDILRIAEIVREETGNDVQEKNYSMLESRMRTHLAKLSLEDMASYWKYFEGHETEERELLQSLMTTHYTFFFREYAHFEVLQKWIDSETPRLKERFAKTNSPVRVWSAACSRGQEVYSLAMFLELNLFKKIGVPFEIVGTDIDPESVKSAKNGVYPIKEVNTIAQNFVSLFWKRGTGNVKEFAAVHPSLKSRTRFETLNLLETTKWSEKNSFDVIFCRNVFIYFSAENVRSIALDLVKRLDGQGLFVSGMSEPLRFEGWALESVGPSCYQRVKSKVVSITPEKKSQPAAAAKSDVPVNSEVKKYKVLCVDDSTTIQLLMKKIFSQDVNCQSVDTAGNGKEAREKLDAGTYDLITLDIHMPEVSGIEFLERLYNRASDPPVIMISSVNRTDLDLATKSMSLGAFDYVEKPAMNNLQKSAAEILTKAKMAMRSAHQKPEGIGTFDTSIGQKIVVPDASQCLRMVMASNDSRQQLMQVVKGQKNEYRSPALVIVWREAQSNSQIESDLMSWSERPIVAVRDSKQLFRPNTIYLTTPELANQALPNLKLKSVSIQILDRQIINIGGLPKGAQIQVLLDEALSDSSKQIETQSGIKASDITPATSFPSLSVEFFAHLRKAA